MFLPLFVNATPKNHYIDFNIYIIDNGKKFPLYETQRMYKKFFMFFTDDLLLNKFKDNFYDIKYIEVFIPNTFGQQNVVIGFRNKKKQTLVYQDPFYLFNFNSSAGKLFSNNFLKETRENLETIQTIEDKQYAKIIRINY